MAAAFPMPDEVYSSRPPQYQPQQAYNPKEEKYDPQVGSVWNNQATNKLSAVSNIYTFFFSLSSHSPTNSSMEFPTNTLVPIIRPSSNRIRLAQSLDLTPLTSPTAASKPSHTRPTRREDLSLTLAMRARPSSLLSPQRVTATPTRRTPMATRSHPSMPKTLLPSIRASLSISPLPRTILPPPPPTPRSLKKNLNLWSPFDTTSPCAKVTVIPLHFRFLIELHPSFPLFFPRHIVFNEWTHSNTILEFAYSMTVLKSSCSQCLVHRWENNWQLIFCCPAWTYGPNSDYFIRYFSICQLLFLLLTNLPD